MPMPTSNTPPTPTEARPWLVLLASSPEKAEDRLLKANQDAERRFFNDLFVPYTMMGARGRDGSPPEDGSPLRTALRRYLFVDGDALLLQRLMDEWNRVYEDKLFFLTTDKTSRTPARIKTCEKETIEASCRQRQSFPDLPMPSDGFSVGQTISLAGTPFAQMAADCQVLEVVPKTRAGAVELRVRVTMFGVPFDNFRITFADSATYGAHAALVATSQRRLLDIFSRRVDKKRRFTPAALRQDDATLQAIWADRDRVYREGAMKRHFLAMMLICAHLKGDEEGVARFTAAVLDELKAIATLRESKAATDTRAYLHASLFIATGDALYRSLAKSYVARRHPTSPYLRKLVATMSKFSATPFVGPMARLRHAQATQG